MNKVEIAYNKGYRVANGFVYNKNGDKLNPRIGNVGYYTFSIRLSNPRRKYYISVHRLVAFQKYGKKMFDGGIEVRHLDGNKLNNLEYNILLGTSSQNSSDIPPEVRMKTSIIASTKVRVYSDEEVQSIKNRKKEGATYKQLVDEFGLSGKGHAYYIVNNNYVTNIT